MTPQALKSHIEPKLDYLFTARPTAVNLGAAIRRLKKTLENGIAQDKDTREISKSLVDEGKAIDGEDVNRNKLMSKWGGEWLAEETIKRGGTGDHLNVMTVCNTGSLATSACIRSRLLRRSSANVVLQGYGTALGLITYLHETGKLETAYFTQSTPYHQGSRCVSQGFDFYSFLTQLPAV